MNMKLTMIAVATLGAAAFALLFFSQWSYDRESPTTPAVQTPSPFDHADLPGAAPAGPLASHPEPMPPAAVSSTAPVSPESQPWEGDAWAAAVGAYERGELELAAEALEVAIQDEEDSAYRHYLLGVTLRRLGEAEGAVGELRRSLELAPASVRALVNLGRAYLDLGESAAAREAIDVALEHDLEDADAWNVLGRIELTEAHPEEAAAAFEKALSHDPQHLWALNNLGYARIQQGRYDDALMPLCRAASLRGDVATVYNNLGVALERCGDWEGAGLAYGRAASLEHAAAEESFTRVGEILLARGESLPEMDELAERLQEFIVAALSRYENPDQPTDAESEELIAAGER